MNNLIIYWIKYYIDKNFQLTYDYLNEAIDYVESCKDFRFLFFRLNCDYYLNPKFILTLNDMSKSSIQIIQNINTNGFLNAVEEYYYSFKKELSQKQIKINEDICSNNKGFSYLNNINEGLKFDFTKIKSYIQLNTIQNLYQYSYKKHNSFLYDLIDFTQKKKDSFNILNLIDYDVFITSFGSFYKCISRNNCKYIYTSNSLIEFHLKDCKESILNNYLEKQKEIRDFSEKYCNNLILSLKENSNENKFKINLYSMFERYRTDIINVLENIINYEFINEIFDEYKNNFYNISLTKKVKYLKEIIYNLGQIYSNTPYLIGNEEIKKIDDNIN